MDMFMEWQSLVIEAGGSDWPDNAKKISLDQTLNEELAQVIIIVQAPSDFEAYCNALKEVDDRL